MKSEVYNKAFTTIAPYYDRLMSFINYPSWVSYIEAILSLNDIKEKTILDLACGTGVCLELWGQRGYKIIGLDKSLIMLMACQKRFSHIPNGNVYLVNGDMRNFTLASKFPIITSLYDSLNYLLTEEDFLYCFENVYDALTDNGIFIFDMNTVHCLRDEWGNNRFYRRDSNIYSTWSNTFDPSNYISSLKITLEIQENGNIKTIREFHQERAYPLSIITNLLSKTGFKFSLYRHLTFKPAQESDLRIMAVARK